MCAAYSPVLTSVDLNAAVTRTDSVGNGGTNRISNMFHVLIKRISVFSRQERQTDVCRKAFKMSDRVKPQNCAVWVVVFSDPHTWV